MKNENCLLELAELIPVRNINFFLDAYNVMRAIDLDVMWSCGESRAELKKLKDVIANGISPEAVIQSTIGYLTCINRMDTPRGMELLGHVVLKHVLQKEENCGEQDGASRLPFIFTAYSLVQDLIFHGYGPNYTFVGEVFHSLPERIVTEPNFSGAAIENICGRYTCEDIAALFLAYSFVVNRTLRPLVPFPRNSSGFPAFIFSEAKMLFPRLFQVIGLSM
jgi:hypothetical protein